eukprot:350278_1
MSVFQHLIKNQDINWNKIKKSMVSRMLKLINTQRNKSRKYDSTNDYDDDDTKQQSNESNKFISSLFAYFCSNSSLTWICMRNFEAIPLELKQALFKNNDNSERISFTDFISIFPACCELILNNLDNEILTKNASEYVESVKKYIKFVEENQDCDNKLIKITFESNEQTNAKSNSTLNKIKQKHDKDQVFIEYGWNIKYEFKLERTHVLTFKKKK